MWIVLWKQHGNQSKEKILTLGFNKPFADFSFENTIIKSVTEEKILGKVIDNDVNFKSHMKKICNAANQKLSAFSRMLELTIPTQSKKLINYFINAQFTSCPLIWCSLQRSTVNQLIKYMRGHSG